MTGDVFTPSTAGAGNYYIKYTFTDGNNCVSADSLATTVNALPSLTMPSLSPICLNASPLALTGAVPSGGTWTGNGVANNTFDPSLTNAATHYLTYTFTDANGCTNYDSSSILVNALPVLNISGLNANYCENDAPNMLTGTPTGGTFIGTGMTGSQFDPSVNGAGLVSISYYFTDANGCFNIISNSVPIYPVYTPSFTGLDANYCVNDSMAYLMPDSMVEYSPETESQVLTSILQQPV